MLDIFGFFDFFVRSHRGVEEWLSSLGSYPRDRVFESRSRTKILMMAVPAAFVPLLAIRRSVTDKTVPVDNTQRR